MIPHPCITPLRALKYMNSENQRTIFNSDTYRRGYVSFREFRIRNGLPGSEKTPGELWGINLKVFNILNNS
jgi:hypothetical protein